MSKGFPLPTHHSNTKARLTVQPVLADGAREERRALARKSGRRVAAAGRLAEAAIPARLGAAGA